MNFMVRAGFLLQGQVETTRIQIKERSGGEVLIYVPTFKF
jgi:hypothetical protein